MVDRVGPVLPTAAAAVAAVAAAAAALAAPGLHRQPLHVARWKRRDGLLGIG